MHAMNSHPAPVSRRTALKIIGVTAASAGLGLTRASAGVEEALGWELPPLGYGYGALEPHFDARTMEIHHTKHHQAYITNAKNLLKDHPDLLQRGPEALVRALSLRWIGCPGVNEVAKLGIEDPSE